MSFAPEDRLLIQCSRVKMNDEAIAIASDLLRQDLDWDYILEASILHGVAPLFHHGLAQLATVLDTAAVIPQAIQEQLEQLYLNNLARNRRLYGVMREICIAFEQVGIKIIGLKDLALARTVFPDMGLRPLGDLDLLIRKEDYVQVEQCLAGLGFSPVPSSDCPYILKYAWALHFRRLADNVWVDVQWGVLQLEWDIYGEGNFDWEIDRLWRGAQALILDGCEILAPKPEDMLFHLCMHLEGHRYAELILFCDIAELIRYYGDALDWNYVIAVTQKYGVEASIYYTLFIIQQLFDRSLPIPLQELRPDYFKANLFEPVFGNLTDLHVSLDEIHRTASPPAEVMAQFETLVRRQAAHAMRLYEEIDRLAVALKELGASVVIWDGAPSQRIFPSQALEPFSTIRLFMLDQDRSRLLQALTECSFETDQESSVESYFKCRVFESQDPATGNAPLTLEIRCQIIEDLESLLHSGVEQIESKRKLALQALAGALRHDKSDPVIKAQLHLVVTSPEEMVLYLAARSGQRQHERLFGSCSLLEFFRCYRGSIDWQRVADAAEQYGLGHQVYAGLLMANALLNPPVSAKDLARFNCADLSPRVLQWARYGPAALDRYTSFKASFFYAFTLLSTKGLGAKLKHMGKSKTFLACVLDTVRLGTQFLTSTLQKKKQLTAKDLAYWTELEPRAKAI